MSWNSTVTLLKSSFKHMENSGSSELLFVPLSEGRSPDYAIIVPETNKVYRQDDGRFLGTVDEVFPSVAEQLEAARILCKDVPPQSFAPSSGEENLGYPYVWSLKNTPGPKSAKWELTEGQDRAAAVLSRPDSGKFSIFFTNSATREPRPEIYRHIQGFDWNSNKDVTRLNKWRGQLFARRLGGKRFEKTSGEPWTADEQEQLGQIIKRALNITSGDWEQINFEVVADFFNAMMSTATQYKGADLANEECDRPDIRFDQRRHLQKNRTGLVRDVEEIEGRSRATKVSIEATEVGVSLFQSVDFGCLALGSDEDGMKTGGSKKYKAADDADSNMANAQLSVKAVPATYNALEQECHLSANCF